MRQEDAQKRKKRYLYGERVKEGSTCEAVGPRSGREVGRYLPVEADGAGLLSLHPIMF